MTKKMVKMNWKMMLLLPVALMLTAIGCKKKDNTPDNNTNNNFDRGALLTNYADNYILPAYEDMTTKLTDLKAKIDAFAVAPDSAKLVAARISWQTAYLTWQAVDLLEFGPEASISLRNYINTYPVTISKVDANVTSGSYDLEQFGNKDAQGFPALDYLLSGIAGTNAAIISYYTTDASASGRKQYLQALAAKMLEKVTQVKTAWNAYRSTYVSSLGTDAGSSLSLTTNAFVLYFERYLRSGKIGLPAGAMTGVAAPSLTEAYYTPSLSKDLAVAAINAVKNFYNGKGYSNNIDGMGFNDYLTAIGTKDQNGKAMSAVINDDLTAATSSLTALPVTIKDGVSNNRTEILAVYQQLQSIVPLLKVDMVSAFGISITYTDNDGD